MTGAKKKYPILMFSSRYLFFLHFQSLRINDSAPQGNKDGARQKHRFSYFSNCFSLAQSSVLKIVAEVHGHASGLEKRSSVQVTIGGNTESGRMSLNAHACAIPSRKQPALFPPKIKKSRKLPMCVFLIFLIVSLCHKLRY